MAYIAGDFLVNIQGTLANNEIWSNTWSFVGAVTAEEKQDVVTALHSFYNDMAAFVTEDCTTDVATGTDLFAQTTEDYAFSPVVGNNVSAPLPSQLAIRVSLSSGTGVRGGPFLVGFGTSAVKAEGGLIAAATQTQVVGEVDELNTLVLAAGASIGIHRPTTQEVVIATTGRVGQRFDIIRKRANEVLEAYVPIAF